ncbi:MAG: tetratricopeptide repeat protein [Bacteroidota bacterium]|nr:tetratricopeptide repeat protein [Bacteroidota bacterium]
MKKTLILVILIIYILPSNIFGQSDNDLYKDSLISTLEDDSEKKAEVYNKLSKYYYNKDFKEAHQYALMASRSANVNNNEKQLGLSHKNLGNLFLRQSQYDSAYSHYTISSDIFKKISYYKGQVQVLNNMALINEILNQYDLASETYITAYTIDSLHNNSEYSASIFSNLGIIYFKKACYDSAMFYFNKARERFEISNEKQRIANTYVNLGMVYEEKDRYDKVFKYYRLAEKIFDSLGNSNKLALVYHNLGDAYSTIYSYDRSLEYFNKALAMRTENEDSFGIASSLKSIAEVLIIQKKYDKAFEKLKSSLETYKENKNKTGEISTNILICKLYTEQHKYNKAIKLASDNIPIATKIQARSELSSLYNILSTSYSAINDYKNAYKYSEAYHILNDSINSSTIMENIESIRYGYEIRKHIQDNKLLKKEKAINRIKLKQNQTYLKSVSFLSVIFIILLIVIFYQYKNKQRKNRLLSEEKDKLNETRIKLNDFNEKLKSEVAKRTKEIQTEVEEHRKKDIQLKTALKDAEEANYLKNAFLANMSHEIRTPLNGIIGFASLLEIELSVLENKELHEYSVGIQKSGERLLHLLNNVIDISRIEANDLQVTLEECDIKEILTQSSELFRFKANEKGITYNLRLSETPKAYGDKQSISKIIIDIIDNAVKYTEKGFINITDGYLKETQDIFIKIKDTGIGIDKAYLPKIFEAFRQESLGYSRQFQGAGLGLPLAKRLLELMSGRVTIDSVKGEGTIVTIYIPSVKKTKQKSNKEAISFTKEKIVAAKPKLTKKEKDIQLFLVEDDRMNRLVIKKMLIGDWNISTAIDGDETLQMVDKAYSQGIIFDIMLFDINLPSPWDGVKLMHAIKKKYSEYKTIPFIAQTAYAMKGDKEKLLAEGFDNYISKPIQQNKLLKIIYSFLKSKK